MLNIKINQKHCSKRIVVIDAEGSTQEFESVKVAAKELQVTVQYIYLALRTGRKVRGCTIESLEERA